MSVSIHEMVVKTSICFSILRVGSILTCCVVGLHVTSAHSAEGSSSNADSLFSRSITFPYPTTGVVLGQGWDSFTSSGMPGACVDFQISALESTSYQSDFKRVIGTNEVIATTSNSISASFKGFGVGASASISNSSSHQVNSDNQNFLFSFESSFGSTFAAPIDRATRQRMDKRKADAIEFLGAIRDPDAQREFAYHQIDQTPVQVSGQIRLTKNAMRLLRGNSKLDNQDRTNADGERIDEASLRNFRRTCGDSFVSAIHRGTRVEILLSHAFSSLQEKSSFRASLAASGWGGSFSGSTNATMDEAKLRANLSYKIHQLGGMPIRPKALGIKTTGIDLDSILPTAEMLASNPTAFRIQVTPYEVILNEGELGDRTLSPFGVIHVTDYYIALRDIHALAKELLNDVQTTNRAIDADTLALFGGPGSIMSVIDDISVDLAVLETIIGNCYFSREKCTVDSALTEAKALASRQREESQCRISAECSLPILGPFSIIDQLKTENDAKPLSDSSGVIASFNDKLSEYRDCQRREELLCSVAKSKTAFQDALTRLDKSLTPSFYLRFYWYLARLPLPRRLMNDSLVKKLGQKEIKFVGIERKQFEEQFNTRLREMNEGLRNAILVSRIRPWKEYFCTSSISSILCLSEREAIDFSTVLGHRVTTESYKFTVVPPPPPPPKIERPFLPSCLHRFPGGSYDCYGPI